MKARHQPNSERLYNYRETLHTIVNLSMVDCFHSISYIPHHPRGHVPHTNALVRSYLEEIGRADEVLPMVC